MKKAWSRKNLWDNLPPAMKSAVGSALSIVPVKYYFGRRFRQCLRFLDRAQWWSIQQARHYQLQQLRRILTLAYEKTSFYRELFDDAGFDPAEMKTVDDLAALPTIDKTTIQQHLADMCTVPPDSPSVDFASTGGTSGNPLHFYINADRSAAEYAHLTASWQRIGYRLDMPLAVFRGRVVAPDRTGFRHQYDPLLRHHYYSNFHMTDDNMKRYLDHVRTIGPCFLHVYPSSAATLTQFIRRTGIDPPDNVRGIIAESDIVYPDQRRAPPNANTAATITSGRPTATSSCSTRPADPSPPPAGRAKSSPRALSTRSCPSSATVPAITPPTSPTDAGIATGNTPSSATSSATASRSSSSPPTARESHGPP